MKIPRYFSPASIIIFIVLFIELLSDIFYGIDPLYEYFRYIKENHYLWVIPVSMSIPIVFLILDRRKHQKNIDERIQLFQTTIHTVQDILQKSSAWMQNIMLDMEEQNVSDSIKKEMGDCIKENVKLIQTLSSLNYEDLANTSNKHISSFVLNEKAK